MTFRSFLSHFWVTLVTFESLSGLLWDDPQKSLLSHFFVTLIVLGFGGFCGARRVTTVAFLVGLSTRNPPKIETFTAWIGRTPKGAYSSRGRSRHLLETLLRTLLRTPFYCKTRSRPPSQNPSQNPSPEPFPRTFSEPFTHSVLPYDPLGVHPIGTAHETVLGHLQSSGQ